MTKSADDRCRAMLQQVRLGDRTWLIYRILVGTKFGRKVRSTDRLAELPGKVRLNVEGSFGDGKSIRVSYPESGEARRTIVISSAGGGSSNRSPRGRGRRQRGTPSLA